MWCVSFPGFQPTTYFLVARVWQSLPLAPWKRCSRTKQRTKSWTPSPKPAHSHSHTHSSTLCNIRAHAGSDKVFALKQYTARNSICLQMESPSRPRPGIEGLHPFAFSFRHEDTRGTDRTCVNLWPYCKPYICRNQCIGSRPQKTERKK